MKADWHAVCGAVPTSLVINASSLKKLMPEDQERFCHIEVTEDFSLPTLTTILGRRIRKPADIAISTNDEFLVGVAAELRAVLGLPGQQPEVASGFTNKLIMKERVARAGIAVPLHECFDESAYINGSADYLKDIMRRLGSDIFVKPVNQAGSFGARRITSLQCFEQWARYKEPDEVFEVDEFLSGTLYHVDTVIFEGRVRAIFVGEYTVGNSEFLEGKVLGSTLIDATDPIHAQCVALNESALVALNAGDGVYHLELFRRETNGELVFLEVASRPAGAMVPELVAVTHNFDLHGASFLIQAGRAPYEPRRQSKYAVWAWIPAREGVVSNRRSPSVDGDLNIYWRCKVGDRLESPECVTDRIAGLIVTTRDRDVNRRNFDYLKDRFEPISIS